MTHQYMELKLEELEKRIEALEQESQTFKWCTDCREYDQENHCCHRWSKVIRDTVEEMKQEYIERDVLDKIRAEIEAYTDPQGFITISEGRFNSILDKYKAETEAKDTPKNMN